MQQVLLFGTVAFATPPLPATWSCLPVCAFRVPAMCMSEDDILGLAEVAAELRQTLPLSKETGGLITDLVTLNEEQIEPLTKKIYLPDIQEEERIAAIHDLSRALDRLEGIAQGPMLCGKGPTLADASLFPSVTVLEQTLPTFFGWTEWTEEALWWRRPRLHAWYELIQYERPAKVAWRTLVARLEGLDLEALAVDVPTSGLRGSSRK